MPATYKNIALAFSRAGRYSARMKLHDTVGRSLRLVGILGGMGPAATVDLMQKIIAFSLADSDQMHIPLVVWNVPQIPPRSPAIYSANEPSPAPQMLHGARVLRGASVAGIAIACNTAHFWASEIEEAAAVPLLHIADAALDALADLQPTSNRATLLATEGTIRAGFYQARGLQRGLAFDTVSSPTQSTIASAIACVKRGDVSTAQALLFPILDALLAAGSQRVVLACTELPLIVQGSQYAPYTLDATAALARSIIAFSMNETVKANLGA